MDAREAVDGYLGAGRLRVKMWGMGELYKQKWEMGEKKCQQAKNGRNSKLRKGAGRLGEI